MVIDLIIKSLNNQYIRFIFILIGFYAISQITYWILTHIIIKITKKTKTDLDDKILEAIERPVASFLLFAGLGIALSQLKLPFNGTWIAVGISNTLLVVIAGIIISRVLNIIIDKWGESWSAGEITVLDKNLIKLMDQVINLAIYILVFLFILNSVWGIQVGALIASLGVAGIAVAFALQNSLGNIFGGISMIVDKNISVGDTIELDNTRKGVVQNIGFRSTKIRTFNNEILIVPNGKLSESVIENYAKPDPSVRVEIPFAVAYGSDINRVKKLILKELVKVDNFKATPEASIKFLEMGNSSLNFKAYFWVKKYDQRFGALDEANTRIYNVLNKAKITIPFPQMDVYVKELKRK